MNKQYSHLALVLLTAVLLVSSCKKNSPPMASVQIRDAINSSLVNGASVGIHRCTTIDPLCGFIAYRSGTTGNDGTCSFNQEDFNVAQSITVGKNGYWYAFVPKANSILFYPDGWLKLRVIRGTSYPAGAMLRIVANYTPGNKMNGIAINPVADSTILLRAYGGASNRIDWFVETFSPFTLINSGSFLQNIPRQDTVNAVLNY